MPVLFRPVQSVCTGLKLYSQLADMSTPVSDDCAALQIDKIVGRSAPTEFVAAVEQIAEAHHTSLAVDVIR